MRDGRLDACDEYRGDVTVVPVGDHRGMQNEEKWICQCRRCHGVHDAADAVQYVWEWALGSCDVPVVVGVNVGQDAQAFCAFTYWHDEPDEPLALGGLEYMVSCRPGDGTRPTEGDVARWIRWMACEHPPRDWLLVDGLRFRSVRACVDALRERAPFPGEHTIAGEWDGPPDDDTWRAEIRADWPAIRARNQAFRRF